MYPDQFIVLIAGRSIRWKHGAGLPIAGIKECPSFIHADCDCEKGVTTLAAHQTDRGNVIFNSRNPQEIITIPVVVFSEKEAFLITALSCNRHEKWDPSLQDRLPHHLCCGEDKRGDAFIHVGNMEQILHDSGLPITWFIDPPVAAAHLEYFEKGRRSHGDEIAFMPSSYSHFNPVNYNLEKTLDETTNFLREGIHSLEKIFQCRISTVAIDQFIGSIGTNFTRAAAALGINALWGMGFDHFTCDTSMFHGGCPWNPYRPDSADFRIPNNSPLAMWIFQWTFRDLINTVHVPGGASGAVMFSTDVDDILCTSIAAHQDDYYHRLARELLENKKSNDMIVMTIHQEDHDSWNKAGLEYYSRFFSNLPEDLTPATMGEVAAWLDLKYPMLQEPVQCLRLEDPLTCKDDVQFIHPDVRKPADWPSGGGKYPPHIFYYDSNFQIIFIENSPTPFRFIDYRKKYAIAENGFYPPENLPEVRVSSLMWRNGALSYNIYSSEPYENYPLAVWTNEPAPEDSIPISGGFIVFISLKEGGNKT